MTSPERKLFVIRKEKQQPLQEYLEQNCRPLYGSDAYVDEEGNIFYPVWRQIKSSQVGPLSHHRLSKRREAEEKYLERPLTTLTPYEKRINEVTKDGGSVEAAIRSVEHALVKYLPPLPAGARTNEKQGKEREQVAAVKERVSVLLDLFGSKNFSEITQEEFEEAQRKTLRRLIGVGLDPDRVLLKEKERMSRWLIKGSRGKDSLGRSNWLISTQALEAAYRRAVTRELGIGEITGKFLRMREALRFEREFSREIFQEAIARFRQMPIHSVFKHPDQAPPGSSQLNIFRGVLNTTIWQLEQPHVKPYRPVGRSVGEILEITDDLLAQDQREEIIERALFGLAKKMFEDTLLQQREIYPPS